MVNIYLKKTTTLKTACIFSELKYISLLYQSTWYLVKILANKEVHKVYRKTKEQSEPEKDYLKSNEHVTYSSPCVSFLMSPGELPAFFLSFLLSKVSVETEIHWTELKRQLDW